MSEKLLTVKQAAEYLNVSPWTIRAWDNNGDLKSTRGISNNRLFSKKDLDEYYEKRTGAPLHPQEHKKYFYIRSSDGNDVTLETQEKLLTSAYGQPDKVFKDKGSGLNENRKQLQQMLNTILTNNTPTKIYITNKDRLTRFGYTYIETLAKHAQTEIITLNNPQTKEPQETLLEDFMSLLASFSGKFYRLRGYSQQKQLLNKAQNTIQAKQK